MSSLRITSDGTVCGLWTDHIDWPALGRVSVQRASHVEFDSRTQLWTVREVMPTNGLRRIAQSLLGRPMGETLFRAHRREEALAWERAWFGPGGRGWRPMRGRREIAFRVARLLKLFPLNTAHPTSPSSMELTLVSIMRTLFAALFRWLRPPQRVRNHQRRQAFGPGWSRHRPRRIRHYTRRPARPARRQP